MLPHQERVVTEKQELDGKIDKLATFLCTGQCLVCSNGELTRLHRQIRVMRDYSGILSERIAAF